jgi:hypothetical protein
MGGELGPHHDAKSAAALRDQVLGIYRTPRECKGSEKRHARRCQALGRGPHTQGPRRSLRSGHRVRVGGPGHDHPSGLPRPDRATPRRGAARTGWMDGHGHYGPRDSACAGAHAAAVRDLHYPCHWRIAIRYDTVSGGGVARCDGTGSARRLVRSAGLGTLAGPRPLLAPVRRVP